MGKQFKRCPECNKQYVHYDIHKNISCDDLTYRTNLKKNGNKNKNLEKNK